jgi:hypothetical protein
MRAIWVLADPVGTAGDLAHELVTSFGAEFTVKLRGAMLRDTLDGLLSIPADTYRCACPLELASQVHPPWELCEGSTEADGWTSRLSDSELIVSRADSPTAPTDPLRDAVERLAASREFAILGANEDDSIQVLGLPPILDDPPVRRIASVAELRAFCSHRSLGLLELPTSYRVAGPEDFDRLVAEVRAHPDRAPACADFFVRTGW